MSSIAGIVLPPGTSSVRNIDQLLPLYSGRSSRERSRWRKSDLVGWINHRRLREHWDNDMRSIGSRKKTTRVKISGANSDRLHSRVKADSWFEDEGMLIGNSGIRDQDVRKDEVNF